MPKTFLSKLGYAVQKAGITTKELNDMKRELVGRPKNSFNDAPVETFPVFSESRDNIYVPKCYGIDRYGESTALKSYIGTPWACLSEFHGHLRDYQIEAQDAFLEKKSGIISLKTGQGKTVTAISILSKLKIKTLIIVNKLSLVEQWKEELTKFLPGVSIGIIQGTKRETHTDITIAMLQSISKKDCQGLFADYGVTVIDEIHNVCSKVFSRVLGMTCSRYTLGLTATPTRSDGCEYIFKWSIGDILYQSKEDTSVGKPPIVRILKLTSPNYKEYTIVNYSGKPTIQYTSMITHLVTMRDRNDFICTTIKDLVGQGRKLLVLSERRTHLTRISKMLGDSFSIGMFVGGMKSDDLKASRQCSVILATFSAFSEGVSEKDLDTLLLLTPKKYVGHITTKNESGKLEQICGRIFRKSHDTLNPMIVDFQDNFSVYTYQGVTRKIFYKKHFKRMIFEERMIALDTGQETVIRGRNEDTVRGDKDDTFDMCLID